MSKNELRKLVASGKLEPRSIKFHPESLREAKAKGIDVAAIARAALNEALKTDTCPTCGNRVGRKAKTL